MVIKALFEAWRSGQAMHRMYDEFLEMLDSTQWMFETLGYVLFGNLNPEEVAEKLHATDRTVNQTERKIRKEIVEHLAIRPGGDVPTCLVLMSIVKDAERIGDYCKNLFEVRGILGKTLAEDEMTLQMRDLHKHILATFSQTRTALKEGDGQIARAITGKEDEIARELDAKVEEVAKSDMTARDAVGRALCIRHMKRIHAHLCNIASSVVQPVHKLDYDNKKTSS